MGNSRSQQSEVETFYNSFSEPYQGPYHDDDVDSESEIFSNESELVPCPQCGDRYPCLRILYTENSVCRKCMSNLSKKGWGQNRRLSVEYRGRYVDARFPQSVAWNFGGTPVPEKREKRQPQRSALSDSWAGWKTKTALNKVYQQNPLPLTKREILDRVTKIEDVETIPDTETPRRSLLQRRQSIVPPAYFKMLTNGEFKQHAYQPIRSRPFSFCLIDGNIWCAHEHEITAWSTNFKPIEFEKLGKYKIAHSVISEIQSLTQLKSGRIVIASGSGLHIITQAGSYDARIAHGVYTDVAVQEDTLYACTFSVQKKSKMEVYDESIPWALLKTITLPCDGLFTVHVWEGMITACSASHGGLYILDNEGQLLKKCALKLKHGSLGQFNEPRICHGGVDGSMLVADRENGCLQVRTVNGDWGLVQLEIPIQKPACALFYKKQLFIAQSCEPYRIYKYI